jgi:hypothetical protein
MVRAGTRVSVTTWAVCTNTQEPGDVGAESAHRKSSDLPCKAAQVAGRAALEPSKPRLSRGFLLQSIWASAGLHGQVRLDWPAPHRYFYTQLRRDR